MESSSSFTGCQVKSISQYFFPTRNIKVKSPASWLIWFISRELPGISYPYIFRTYTIFKAFLPFNEKQTQKHRKLMPVFTLTNFLFIPDIISSFTNKTIYFSFFNWGGGRKQHYICSPLLPYHKTWQTYPWLTDYELRTLIGLIKPRGNFAICLIHNSFPINNGQKKEKIQLHAFYNPRQAKVIQRSAGQKKHIKRKINYMKIHSWYKKLHYFKFTFHLEV